jgi:apoptosis-inducing factor 2
VKEAGPRIYCIGALASYAHGNLLDIRDAVGPLAAVMEFDLSGGKSGKEVVFKVNGTETQVVPVGRSKAVGVIFNVRVPGCVAWLLKGRTFMGDQAKPNAYGALVKKKTNYR